MNGYEKTKINKLNEINNDNVVDVEPVMENFNILDENLGDVKSLGISGYDEGVHGDKSVVNYIKFLWGKLGSIELTDLKVKVTTWGNQTLDRVLSKLKDTDTMLGNRLDSVDNIDNTQNQAIEKLKNQTKAISDELDGSNSKFSSLNDDLEWYIVRLKRLRG